LKYAELDRLEAEIADRLARSAPCDLDKRREAENARTKAERTRASIDGSEPGEIPAAKPDSLKMLYRDVAKSVHPDLANEPDERARRDQWMARANEAYRKGDEKALEAILQEWRYSPDTVKGQGVEAKLIRTLRKIAQAKARLAQIEKQIAEMESGDLFQLYEQVTKAKVLGRDILSEMALAVDVRIQAASERLTQVDRETTSYFRGKAES
jgi:hypothetical protein